MEKYKEIATYIENQIKRKSLIEGKKIPSVRDMAVKYNCSKITVVKAYDLLREMGMVYSKPKSGYYVLKNIVDNNPKEKEKIDFISVSPDKDMIPYKDFKICVSSAMEIYEKDLFNVQFSKGLPELIDTVCDNIIKHQIFAKKDNIFITSGTQQAINILVQMPFCNDGDAILVEEPTYHGMINALKINNSKVLTIDRKSEELDLNLFESILKNNKIKFFYTMPSYHNPTSYSLRNKQRKEILYLLEKYDTYLVEDDYVSDLEVRKNSYPMYAMDMNDRVVYLKSYPKILMPGLRVAVVIVPEKIRDEFEMYKKWNDLNTSIVSQGALQIYIKNGMFENHTKVMRNVFCSKMKRLKGIIEQNKCDYIKWNIPDSGFVASFRIVEKKNLDNIIRELRRNNVYVDNTLRYYINKTEDRFIRISLSNVSDEGLEAGVNKIIELIK